MSTLNGGPNLIVTDGLVLYLDAGNRASYPGSGTTWRDLSAYKNNGTLTNGPTFSSANGGSIVFDGTDDYVNIGNQSALNFTSGVFSIEAWFYIPSTWTSGARYPNLFSKGPIAGFDTDGWSLWVFRDWGEVSGPYSWGYGARNGGTYMYVARGSAPSNTYIYAVATVDGSTIRIYENGFQVNTGAQTINPGLNSTDVLIGRDPSSIYFPGRVAIIRAYNRALSASEVLQNYNAQKSRFGL